MIPYQHGVCVSWLSSSPMDEKGLAWPKCTAKHHREEIPHCQVASDAGLVMALAYAQLGCRDHRICHGGSRVVSETLCQCWWCFSPVRTFGLPVRGLSKCATLTQLNTLVSGLYAFSVAGLNLPGLFRYLPSRSCLSADLRFRCPNRARHSVSKAMLVDWGLNWCLSS